MGKLIWFRHWQPCAIDLNQTLLPATTAKATS